MPRGDRKKKTRKRRTSAPARKKKYVRTFFILFLFFSAFLGVSRQGSSKTREEKIEYVSKKKSPGKYLFGCFFLTSFPFDFFVALVKRLSVRGTQRRD
jgi:hypothetical protein